MQHFYKVTTRFLFHAFLPSAFALVPGQMDGRAGKNYPIHVDLPDSNEAIALALEDNQSARLSLGAGHHIIR
jgi:hypothetical protein